MNKYLHWYIFVTVTTDYVLDGSCGNILLATVGGTVG